MIKSYICKLRVPPITYRKSKIFLKKIIIFIVIVKFSSSYVTYARNTKPLRVKDDS
jgi:hypothetical protein